MHRDSIYVLLAILGTLLLINNAFPSLPELDRIPELQPQEIPTPDFNEALRQANSEAKPIVIFVNTPPLKVKGCVVCKASSWDGMGFNVGVVIGAPSNWKPGHQGKVEQILVGCCYGPRSAGHILAILKEYKQQLEGKGPEDVATKPSYDSPSC